MSNGYFKAEPGAPMPLKKAVRRTVRFEEVDALNIVWHGRYASYFEDARVALGESIGLGYMDYYEQGIVTPIKKLHVDYVKPLRYMDYFSIEAIMHWTEAARINMEFILRDREEAVVATGYSIQLMLDKEGELLLGSPPCHQRMLQRWRSGDFDHLKTGWQPGVKLKSSGQG